MTPQAEPGSCVADDRTLSAASLLRLTLCSRQSFPQTQEVAKARSRGEGKVSIACLQEHWVPCPTLLLGLRLQPHTGSSQESQPAAQHT